MWDSLRLCFCYFDEICYKCRQQTHMHTFITKISQRKNMEKKNLNGSAYIIYVNKQTIILKKIQCGMSVHTSFGFIIWLIVKAIKREPSPSIFACVGRYLWVWHTWEPQAYYKIIKYYIQLYSVLNIYYNEEFYFNGSGWECVSLPLSLCDDYSNCFCKYLRFYQF